MSDDPAVTVDGQHEDEPEPIRLDAIVPTPQAQGTRRIPITQEWVKFSGDYAFMEVKVWVDAPARVMEGLTPQAVGEDSDVFRARVLDTLGKIVLEHRFDDGSPWTDAEGVLPPPQDATFWDRVPQPIVTAIVAYIRDRIANHPTLRRSTRTQRP